MDQDHQTFLNLINKQTDSNLMVVDFADLDKRAAAHRSARDASNPPKPDSPRAEFNKLRRDLFDRQEWAKNAEIYRNEKAGVVKQLEGRITDLLKQKKAAGDNPLAERNFEHQIQLLETELLDAKAEFNRAKIQSGNAARGLKSFGGHARIVELKLELGIA